MQVPIVRTALGEAEIDAVARVIRSGWVAQGPEVEAFEREFCTTVNAHHAIAVSNCTVALELALRVSGVSAGDDVATVSHSFIATANAVVAVGARPIFVDVQPGTLGMDPEALERAITGRTRAVLCVHQVGFPCDLPAILEVARRRGLPVIEDAACALGSEIRIDGRWERIGRPHGLIACFSFHPRKILTTGDGGMLTTSDAALAERLRRLRQHALVAPAPGSSAPHGFSEPAYNYRLTDLQAAVGRPQLARLDAILAERQALAGRYAEALAGHPLLAPVVEPAWARTNWQSYPLGLREGATQAEIMRALLDRGVSSRPGIGNAHAEPAYAQAPWSCGPRPCDPTAHAAGHCLRLPVSEAARDHTILIPLFHGMFAAEQSHVIAALQACI